MQISDTNCARWEQMMCRASHHLHDPKMMFCSCFKMAMRWGKNIRKENIEHKIKIVTRRCTRNVQFRIVVWIWYYNQCKIFLCGKKCAQLSMWCVYVHSDSEPESAQCGIIEECRIHLVRALWFHSQLLQVVFVGKRLCAAWPMMLDTNNDLGSAYAQIAQAIFDGSHLDVYFHTYYKRCKKIAQYEARGFINKTPLVVCPRCTNTGGMQLLACSFGLAALFWSNFCCYPSKREIIFENVANHSAFMIS